MDALYPLASPCTERALLAGLFVNPGERDLVRAIVRPEDLYLQDYQKIYEAMLRAEAVDLIVIEEELRRMCIDPDALCDEHGQPIRLSEVLNEEINGLNVQAYARQLADYATRRRFVAAGRTLAQLAYATDVPVEQVAERSMSAIMQAAIRSWRASPEIGELAEQWGSDFLESLDRQGALPGIATKIAPLDKALRGLRPGKLVTVAARPGVGKSALMVQFALRAAVAGHNTLLCSLEMSESEIVGRMVSNRTGIDAHSGDGHLLTAEDQSKVLAAVNSFKRLPSQSTTRPVSH